MISLKMMILSFCFFSCSVYDYSFSLCSYFKEVRPWTFFRIFLSLEDILDSKSVILEPKAYLDDKASMNA